MNETLFAVTWSFKDTPEKVYDAGQFTTWEEAAARGEELHAEESRFLNSPGLNVRVGTYRLDKAESI